MKKGCYTKCIATFSIFITDYLLDSGETILDKIPVEIVDNKVDKSNVCGQYNAIKKLQVDKIEITRDLSITF